MMANSGSTYQLIQYVEPFKFMQRTSQSQTMQSGVATDSKTTGSGKMDLWRHC